MKLYLRRWLFIHHCSVLHALDSLPVSMGTCKIKDKLLEFILPNYRKVVRVTIILKQEEFTLFNRMHFNMFAASCYKLSSGSNSLMDIYQENVMKHTSDAFNGNVPDNYLCNYFNCHGSGFKYCRFLMSLGYLSNISEGLLNQLSEHETDTEKAYINLRSEVPLTEEQSSTMSFVADMIESHHPYSDLNWT